MKDLWMMAAAVPCSVGPAIERFKDRSIKSCFRNNYCTAACEASLHAQRFWSARDNGCHHLGCSSICILLRRRNRTWGRSPSRKQQREPCAHCLEDGGAVMKYCSMQSTRAPSFAMAAAAFLRSDLIAETCDADAGVQK